MPQGKDKRPDGESTTNVEVDELVRYYEGDLGPTEEDAVRAKLIDSPEAVDQLLALDDLASKAVVHGALPAEEGGSSSDLDAGWESVAARLNLREKQVRRLDEPTRSPVGSKGTRHTLARAASLAFAVLGLGLLSTWLWLDRRSLVSDRDHLQQQVAALSAPQINVAVIELVPPGWARGASAGGAFDLSTDAAVVHVLLNLPQPSAGEAFSLRISDDTNATIWRAKGLIATIENTVAFALKAQLLPSGRYRLELTPDDGRSSHSTIRYSLEINSPVVRRGDR